MIKEEFKNLLKNKFLIIALIAIMAIPTIYTTLFLGSMWDPYGKIDNLPVAVVNNDISIDYENTKVDVGNKLIANLKKNNSLAFNFVDKESASKGLENGTYYMVITIPKDFSKNATTLLDKTPKKMVLEYATNPGTNYIASKMSETALAKIQTTISEEVTKTYADTVFEELGSIGDGMQNASDGSLDLKNGLDNLGDGGAKLNDGLNILSNSMLTFTDGTSTLSQGLNSYLTGVESINSASGELSSGASKLAVGANQLNSAVQEISIPSISLSEEQKNTIKNTAAEGVSNYSSQLSAGIGSAVSGKINSTLTSKDTINTVSLAILSDANVNQMITTLVSAGYTKEQAQGLVVGIISNTLNGVSSNITSDSITNSIAPTVSTTMKQIAGGAAEKSAEGVIKEVNSNLSSYEKKFATLKESTKTLSQGLNTLSSGATKLNAGSKELVSNNSKLKEGMSSLSDGTSKISTGVNDLFAGSTALNNALKTAYEGSDKLHTGINDGAKTIKETTSTIDNDTLNMFSHPVDKSETKITKVKDNGHAMAAYMMVVGLWVGAMGFCTVYPLSKSNVQIKSGFRLWLTKATIMYPVAILSSIAMIGGLSYFNGFSPANLHETMLVAALASVTFISIIYFLNLAFGLVGKFLAFVLMIIQLSGCTGTYPMELSGNFVAKITNYLPFTHVVKAFRSTISGGPSIENHLIFLSIVAVVCILVTIIFMEFKVKYESSKSNSSSHKLDSELAI